MNILEILEDRYKSREVKTMLGPFYDSPGQYDELFQSVVKDERYYQTQAISFKALTALELGCGTGRVALELARSNIKVVGIDNSNSMLMKAQEKAVRERLEVQFQLGDMRTLNLGSQFDFVYSPHGSFHHLLTHDDLIQTLTGVKHHLKKDGHFCFDVTNPEIKLLAQEPWQKFLVHKYFDPQFKSEVQVYQQVFYESASQICNLKWTFEADGQIKDRQEFSLRMFFPQEINFILESQGFEIVEKYGSAQLSNFLNISRQQYFICKIRN